MGWKIEMNHSLPTSSSVHDNFSNISFQIIHWEGPTAVMSGDVGEILLLSSGALEHVVNGVKMGELDAWSCRATIQERMNV